MPDAAFHLLSVVALPLFNQICFLVFSDGVVPSPSASVSAFGSLFDLYSLSRPSRGGWTGALVPS